ncbi:MAG: pyridoxamine 5'-phosphate oxidase family protein [Bdellovibrionota bacterium]
MSCPSEIHSLLQEVFVDGSAYGQFATVDPNHLPSVRTVHFIAGPNLASIVINTHIQSEKWANIASGQSHVSGCYWSQEKRIQFRFSAKAELIQPKQVEMQPHWLSLWNNMRAEVRTAYILADHNIPLYRANPNVDPVPHSPSHGLIVCRPYCWDIFYEDPKEYRFGKRHIYTLDTNQSWQKKDVSSLHEKDILLYDGKS